MNILHIAIALMLLTSCTGITGNATVEPIRIGWIGALTGPQAVVGIDAAVAAQMAVDDINAKGGINGRHVELLVEDDEYNTANTISAYHKLKESNVQVIIMSTYGSIFALAEQAKQDGIIIIDPLDCDNQLAELNENIFCIAPTTEEKAHAIVKQAQKLNIKKIGIIVNNGDTFMPSVGKLITQEIGQENTITETYAPTTRDFSTSILKLQEEQVQGIVFLGNDETGIAMKQARENGFKGTFFGTGAVTSPSLQAAAHQTSEGIYFGYWQAPAEKQEYNIFIQKFVEKQKRKPLIEFVTAATYDAVGIIAKGYEHAATKETLAKEIANVQYTGIIGTTIFDEAGAASLPIKRYQLQNGSAVMIE